MNTPPWVIFMFFKLCKWYQIAQRTTYRLQQFFWPCRGMKPDFKIYDKNNIYYQMHAISSGFCKKIFEKGWANIMEIYFKP